MTANEKAYLALVEAAQTRQWPASYSSDLYVIDAGLLGCYPEQPNWKLPEGMPFGWILRDMGTHIIAADAPIHNNTASYYAKECDNANNAITAVRKNPISHDMAKSWCSGSSSSYLYFWWDGESLMRVPSPHTILDRMRDWQRHNPDKVVPYPGREETAI